MRVKAFLDNAYRLNFARDVATSQPIFYCNSTAGSDSNNGLTAGTAFATIPKAIDALTAIDCNGFDPLIYLAPGDYLIYTPILLQNVVGVGLNVAIVGTGTNNTSTRILSGNQGGNAGYANSVIVNYSTVPYLFENLTITHQWDDVQYPTYPKYIVNEAGKLFFDNVRVLGNGASHDVFTGYAGASWIFLGSLDIQGTFRWVFDLGGGAVNLREIPINSLSNPTFDIFAKAHGTYFAAYNITLSGSATGKRFEVVDSVFDTVGFALSLPGSIAGTNTYPGLSGGNTDLSIANRTSNTLDILSSSGDGDTIPAATTTLAGLLSGSDKTKLNNAIESTQLGANNGVAQLGSTGKHLPGQALPNSVTYTASTGVFDFTWADGSTQSINLPIENLFQDADYDENTQILTLITNGGGTLDVSLTTLLNLDEIVVAQSDPATTPSSGQKLYLRSDTGEYWIAASGAWQGKYLAFTAAERSKLSGIQAGAINQATADGLYRLQSDNIPATDISGTIAASQIDGSIVRSNDVRLSDQRIPTDGSVNNAKIASNAAIEWSKISRVGAVPSDIGAIGATTTIPSTGNATLGFAFGSGAGASNIGRFQWGDVWNSFASSTTRGFLFQAYHGFFFCKEQSLSAIPSNNNTVATFSLPSGVRNTDTLILGEVTTTHTGDFLRVSRSGSNTYRVTTTGRTLSESYAAITLYTVSTLPPTSGRSEGELIRVSNGRKVGEGAGAGTGVWCELVGSTWCPIGTTTAVQS